MELDLNQYQFGTEIEFTGISREKAAKAVADVLNSQPVYRGGGYYKYEIRDSTGRIWQVMRDSSITPQKKSGNNIVGANDEYRCELVTPILHYDADMPILQEIIRALRKSGGITNASCGMHVHIGAELFTPRSLRNLANIFKAKQDLLYKALEVKPNRTHYCKKLEDEFVDRLNKHKPDTVEKFADEVYQNYGGYEREHRQHYSSSRYFGLNFHAFYTKRTLEFRLYNAVLSHAAYARTYVILSIAMVNQSVNQKNASAKPTISENECFTFRTWLLRMGFIGEIYETPRRLLLKNLEGNSAWRYGLPNREVVHGDAPIGNNDNI